MRLSSLVTEVGEQSFFSSLTQKTETIFYYTLKKKKQPQTKHRAFVEILEFFIT